MRKMLVLLSLLAIEHALGAASAETVIYPISRPEVVHMWHEKDREKRDAPKWLQQGSGDDGYVSVSASILTPRPCTNLGSPGIFGIAAERIQIVVTLRSSGFRSAFEEMDIPIATFDARDTPQDCWGLTTLPKSAIPYSKLPQFSAMTPGTLGLLVKVRSSANRELNIIPAAQALAEVAGVFASGPAGGTVAATSTTLAKPVLASVEKGMNKSLSTSINGESAWTGSWFDVRRGISSMVIPVYLGNAPMWESAQKAITRLQAQNPQDERTKLFDIVLTFQYTKSIFDVAATADADLPAPSNLRTARVLNQPSFTPNFLQLLNASSPSPMQALAGLKTTTAWTSECGKVNALLESAGLNRMDRLIVTKAFIDEARGGDPVWYRIANLTNCFLIKEDVELVTRLYGVPGNIVVRAAGSQDGSGEEYIYWAREVLPIMSDLGRSMTIARGREKHLVARNGGHDIPEFVAFEWIAPDTIPTESDVAGSDFFKRHPKIWALASRRATRVGCYAWFDQNSLKKDSLGAYMVVVDENNDRWRLRVSLDPRNAAPLKRIQIWPLEKEWRDAFQSWIPEDACTAILQ